MNPVGASRHLIFWSVTAIGLAVDLYSKSAIFSQLGFPHQHTPWLIDSHVVQFRLYTSMNPGALWGLGAGLTWLFAVMSVLAFVGIVYWLFVRGAAQSLWLTVTLGCVTAGTLGNLYDRLGIHGLNNPDTQETWLAVRDFLHFRFLQSMDWAIFNVADILLVCGAVMLVIQSFTADFDPAAKQVTPSTDLVGE